MHNALVSVILPVHNGERLFPQAVESVLKQAHRPIEIIIIDDGSTDGTAQVAAGLADQVRYLFQLNAGPAAARNLGIRESNGEFIAFIDADDLWPAGKLAAQMRCFEVFPDVEIVQGLIRRILIPRQGDAGAAVADLETQFIYSNLGSMIVRRSVFERIGYFDQGLPYHEDTDFWLRALECGIRVLVQRKLALLYRIHGSSLTAGVDLETLGLARIIRRSINRRRSSSGVVADIGRLLSIPDLLEKSQIGDSPAEDEVGVKPLVSMILYFRSRSADATRAIGSLIAQGYSPAELLVVAPQPGLLQLTAMDRFDRVEVVEAFADLASGLNRALERCRGEMVGFLDVEGEWAPGKLKLQVRHLLENPGDQYVVGRTRHILMPDLTYPQQLIDDLALRKSLGDLLPTLLARRSVFSRVGGFRAGLSGMEETDWILRARDAGIPSRMLPPVVFHRFVQPDAHRLEIEDVKAALLASVRSSLHRKRNASPLSS